MSEKLPRITAEEVIHALERAGFTLSRQSGSHKIFKDAVGKRATVPYHKGRILHPKVLNSILKDAQLSKDDFLSLLQGK